MPKGTNNNSILDKLNSSQIPVLSPGTPALLESLTDDSLDFDETAKIIEQFPGIAARLVALANSAWSAPVKEITSLEMACSRLGLNVVRGLSIALVLGSPFDATRCEEFDAEYYWSNALLVAEVASMLQPLVDVNREYEASTARTAGLIHNLGLLLLVDQLPLEMNQAFKLFREEKVDNIHEALLEVLGCDDGEVGKWLGDNWFLPEPIVNAMSFYNDLNYSGSHHSLVSTVGLAVIMVSTYHHGYPLDLIEQRCELMDIKMSEIEKIQQRLAQHSDRLKTLAAALFN